MKRKENLALHQKSLGALCMHPFKCDIMTKTKNLMMSNTVIDSSRKCNYWLNLENLRMSLYVNEKDKEGVEIGLIPYVPVEELPVIKFGKKKRICYIL